MMMILQQNHDFTFWMLSSTNPSTLKYLDGGFLMIFRYSRCKNSLADVVCAFLALLILTKWRKDAAGDLPSYVSFPFIISAETLRTLIHVTCR